MTPLTSLLVAAISIAGPTERPSPFTAAESLSAVPATRLAVDARAAETLAAPGRFTMTGFPLSASLSVDLVLERFEVLSPDARVVLGTAEGDTPLPRPDVALYRGHVAGDPGSFVFLSLSPHGNNGYLTTAGATHVLSSGPAARGLGTLIYDLAAMPPDALPIEPFVCGADQLKHPTVPAGPIPVSGPGACSAAGIAVDTDYEFTQLFNGDEAASSAYAVTMLGGASDIFTRDAATPLQVVFLRVWGTNEDPWDGATAFEQFSQFRDVWNADMDDVDRNAAHLLSGRQLPGAGGIGYLPGLCVDGFDYAMSAHLNGFFPYPLEDQHPQNWDIIVLTHELGHNFGGPHTHDMSPPVDQCAFGDCSSADEGTIMSYCHTCEGGVSNIWLFFHQRTLDEGILPYLGGLSCLAGETGPIILASPVDTSACAGDIVIFSVVATGGGVMYQWRKDSIDIAGAVGTSLTLPSVTLADAGVYDVVVSNDCGSATSDGAMLTVEPDCCPWDIDGNGLVGTSDLLTLLKNWGLPGPWDIDGGGAGTSDVLLLLAHWGLCP